MSSFITDKKKLRNEITIIKNSEDLFSNDLEKISCALSFFRVLCDDEEPPTKLLIEKGIVARVIELSKSCKSSEIVSDARYILCLMAGGDKKDIINLLELNVLHELMQIFPSEDSELESLILWGCDQFAQTFKGSKELHDNKFIEKLRDRYQSLQFSTISPQILHRLSSLLLTLAMYHSSPFGFIEPIDFELYEPALPILKKVFLEVHEKSVLQTLLKIFSEFTRISDEYIDILLLKIPIFLTKTLELMIKFPHDLIITQTCLEIFINIVSGPKYHSEIIVQNSLMLNAIHLMMNHADFVTKRLACHVIACLSTGPSAHKQILIHHTNILMTLLLILESEFPCIHEKEDSFLLVKECSDALSYLIIGGTHDQVQTILVAHPNLLKLLLEIAKFNYSFIIVVENKRVGEEMSEEGKIVKERAESLFMFSLECLEYLFKNFINNNSNDGDHPEEDEETIREEDEKRKLKDAAHLKDLKKRFVALKGVDFLCDFMRVPTSHPEIDEQVLLLLQSFFPEVLSR